MCLDLNENQELNNISFKNPEIKIGDNYLFLNHINKLHFSFEKSNEIDKINVNNKKSSNNNTLIIVLCVIIGVIVLAGLTVGVLYILKKNKQNNINKEKNVKNIVDQSNIENNDYNASATNINN